MGCAGVFWVLDGSDFCDWFCFPFPFPFPIQVGAGGGGSGHGHPSGGGTPPGNPPGGGSSGGGAVTWPGETNGIPNGLNVNFGGPLGAILPSAICGDMGPCVPIGMGFDPAGLHGPNQTATDLFAGVFSTLWGVIYSVGWTT